MFSQKLDILMNIAGVSNSQMGQAIGMNSSHIGRIRNGKRALPKKHEWLTNACAYMEKHMVKPYQFELLEKIAGIKTQPDKPESETQKELEDWLLSDDDYAGEAAEKFINGFINVSSQEMKRIPLNGCTEEKGVTSPFFYGNDGKREAVIQFFNLILNEEKPQTLLLCSEENMSWLYEDPAFAKKWALLFTKVLMKGNKVKIIHNISRDLNELLEAVSKWIPIYMTGSIEPYCYPRLRDGLFKKTMFIAPMTAAVVSSSVHEDTDGMLNMFITDKNAIAALIKEYDKYFKLCKPLMEIYTAKNKQEFPAALNDVLSFEGDSCTRSSLLPLFSMPEEMMAELQGQTEISIVSIWEKAVERFEKRIKENDVCITVPDKLYSDEKDMICPSIELFGTGPYKYDNEKYAIQLNNLIDMAKKHKNLHVLINNYVPQNTHLYVKEDYAVVMIKTDAPVAAFITKEINMSNAFWDYARRKYEHESQD